MNTCEFYYIRHRDNLPILARGVEKSWSELQVQFGRSGPGYPGATYYKTISPEGPELFAVVNKKWVLYHDQDKWHRYITACDLKYGTIRNNNFNYDQALDKQEDESWIMVSEKDCDTELVDNYMLRIVTWNVGNSPPNCNIFKHLAFASTFDNIQADLIVFGFQETSNKPTGANLFHKILKECLANKNYVEIISDYVGSNIIKPIWLFIYVSNVTMQTQQRINILKWGKEPTLKVYQDKFLESVIGYKGVIASGLRIDNSTNLIFATMHLPAGEGKKAQRCKLWSKFFQTYQKRDVRDDYMFVFGDQNWRTLNSLTIENILRAIGSKDYQTILNNEELTQMRQNDKLENSVRCLNTFSEAPITFPPTYKYLTNSDNYQTNKNNEDRRPSYTDRILVSTTGKDLEILKYSAMDNIKVSDHRPVFADVVLF